MQGAVLALVFSLALMVPEAWAAKGSDIMPPPQKAPRTPVQREALKDATKEPREFEGKARAIDGERLLITDREVRLFGIVTPSLSSNFGPQARSNLDALLQGNLVLCKTTDRDKEGRPIAFCGTVDVPDISLEMLKRGWAMVDRKAIKGSPLLDVYEKAEQEALTANKGLFAPQPLATVVPISNPSKSVVVPTPPPEGKPGSDVKMEVKQTATDSMPVFIPASGTAEQAPIAAKKESVPFAPPSGRDGVSAAAGGDHPSFVERFQILISAFLVLVAAMAFAGSFVVRGRERTAEKRRALAAALRGELMAARHIARTRARELLRRRVGDAEAQPRPSQLWPRLRAMVYQAHVGRIGELGAELARQVASIYGQCADYAVYYQQAAQQRLPSAQAVAETLNTLADHIEIVLEALAQVEASGVPFRLIDEAAEGQNSGEDDAAETEAPAMTAPAQQPVSASSKRVPRVARTVVPTPDVVSAVRDADADGKEKAEAA